MPTDTKSVVRIEVAGAVTSFRYPHFTQGIHPTFELPPPSTIYGLIAAAVGDWFDPIGWEFGYHFAHEGKFVDYKEHLHYEDPIQPMPVNRELLFNPRLTLYLAHDDVTAEQIIATFQRPYYTLSLGRSQDLVCVKRAEVVTLNRVDEGVFDRTLLPLFMAPRLNRATVALTLARYIDARRRVLWANYCALTGVAIYPPPIEVNQWDDEEDGLQFEDETLTLWADAEFTYPRYEDLPRLVWFHRFTEQ